jgi:methylglutaconyl-CoA hydratase
MEFTRIKLEIVGTKATVTLDRPEVKNAFDDVTMDELLASYEAVLDAECRVLVLTGAGDCFSGGADLNYMKRAAKYTELENRGEAVKLASTMRGLHDLPLVTVARVNGPAIAGATGLVAACDVAIAIETAKFAFPEVKLGIAPAVISPFLVERIGPGKARRLFVTGERFGAKEAADWGLVDHCVPAGDLDSTVEKYVRLALSSAPEAVAENKKLVRFLSQGIHHEEVDRYTTELIAEMRASDEGLEGIASFLEKRKPEWAE